MEDPNLHSNRGGASRRKKVIVCILALLASPLVAEIGVRILGVRPAPVPTSVGNILANENDEILIYSNCASGEKTLTYKAGEDQECVVVMRTNSQRFRGPEVSLEKPAGVTRVVCLGDSHTWGDGVDASETWPAQLQERAGEDVQVMNCGVTGYDTLQEALWYERYVEAFDPDVVI
ncbi:MAG: hypothetical protein JKY61_10460, partial [Planctomycetes bacterium]|nr:hypothetical protein [Planctomycetota bacterium]